MNCNDYTIRTTLRSRIRCKLGEWLKRFLPAELIGTLLAVIASYCIFYFTDNRILAAYAGAIANSIGFYGCIFLQDVAIVRKQRKRINRQDYFRIFKFMLIEFGPAELLDSLLLRPFAMYIFPLIINNYTLAILVGKIASDVVFYIPVIITYELRMSKK